MKKNVLVLLVALATSVTISAQSFGVKGGVNFANITESEGAKSRTGMVGGLYANFKLGNDFSVQPEILYSAQGAKITPNEDDPSEDDAKFILDYLTLPIMFQYTVVDGLFLQAGPQIGLLVKDKFKSNIATGDISDLITLISNNEGQNNKLNTIDFSLNFGIGYKTSYGLNIDARYNLGLSEILNIDDNFEDILDNGSKGNGSNRVIQLTLGYDIIKPKN